MEDSRLIQKGLLASELQTALAMCYTYKFDQYEMFIVFEKYARQDITIRVRK